MGLLYTKWGQPAAWAVPTLIAAVAVSELATVHLSFGRQRWSFSCTEGVIGAALVVATGGWVTVVVALGALIAGLVNRAPRLKTCFNVAQFGASGAAAVAMSTYLGGGLLGAIAGMGLFWFANHALVAAAVAATSGRRYRALLWESAPLSALHSSGNTSVGLLAAWLAVNAPFGLLGLIVPMGLLWFSYDQQTARTAEANLFGGADVELILNGADGPVRYLGDEFGVPERHRVDPTAFDTEWVMRVLAAGHVVHGLDQGRPYCSMILGQHDSPLAVINARRPAGAGGFGRREVMLAQVLVGQAESWLSVADLTASRDAALAEAEAAGEAARALGDLGAETSASLVVLRESAGRLARLAEPSRATSLDPASVGDIVDELHAVERAVASLLGAIVLAAETDLAGAANAMADMPAPVRAEPEWTTTGVLSELV
jgi:hypothetical protein